MIPPYDFQDLDSDGEDGIIIERPDELMHYRNYPARPAVKVLEELIAKFRDLEWIPVRYDGGWPEILTAEHEKDNPSAVCLPFPLQSY